MKSMVDVILSEMRKADRLWIGSDTEEDTIKEVAKCLK